MKTKQSWSERIKKRNKLGFSLVELVVVIAIMAIMTAVLAPSLLSYVERSRAQKDTSAMSEVVNSIMLALADQNVYDEVLCYTASDNKSCYVDSLATYDASHSSYTPTKKSGDTVLQYMFNDDARREDENPYAPAGVMRGVTITFEPEQSTNKSCFVLYNGIINKFGPADFIYGSMPETEVNDDDELLLGGMASFGSMSNHYLYNRIRSTVGDKIELTSQTYRNSEYTVFIRMGTTGGNQADKQDAIAVYGQWNGTNLSYGNNGTQQGGSPAMPALPAIGVTAEECSWAELKAIAEAGKGDEYFNLGDTKTMTLSDNTVVVMQIVAFNADEKADGSGVAGITWISKDIVGERRMNSTNTNEGGWEASAMRSWLQGEFYDTLPADVKSVIVPVNKTYYDCTTQSTKNCDDNIWIPSYREVFGNSSNDANWETSGADYTAFFKDNASRVKNYNGSAWTWCLRSSNYDSSSYFYGVHTGGYYSLHVAFYYYGVAFGFCF